jgi:hypothetical protein
VIFTDQHCIVLDAAGLETGTIGEFSDEIETFARAIGGYVVQVNSEPEHVFADFRKNGPFPLQAAARTSSGDTDHLSCAPGSHDRSLPDDGGRPWDQPYDEHGYLSDKQAMAADGLLGCNDCGRPLFWCRANEQYHHVDRDAGCFLAGPW